MGYGGLLSGTGSYEVCTDFISSENNNGWRSNETAASVSTYKKIFTGIFKRDVQKKNLEEIDEYVVYQDLEMKQVL